jgi:hypothetical protein
MSEDKKPREFWGNWMGLESSEQLCKDMTPKAEWSDIKCFVERGDYAQLQKENEELRRLKDELSTAGQRGVEELAKENEELKANAGHDECMSVIHQLEKENEELKKWNEQQRTYFDENAALRESLNLAVEALTIISGKHETFCVDDLDNARFDAEEALAKITAKHGDRL